MSAHTPGPLKVVNGGLSQLAIVAKDGNAVAFVPRGHPDSDANVNLFAAAPDLLEALRNALEYSDCRSVEALRAARAAIAKAEGLS